MKSNLLKYIYYAWLLPALLLSLQGCVADDLPYASEGDTTELSLRLDVPDTDVMTRGIDNAPVKSLWIGIYSATTMGERIYGGEPSRNGDVISGITVSTGSRYIVAVANANTSYGYSADAPGTLRPLSDLLNEADTYDKFMKIMISHRGGDIFDPYPSDNEPMPLAGFYCAAQNAAGEPRPVSIGKSTSGTGGTTIDGVNINASGYKIYLRRPWSQIEFSVKPEQNSEGTGDLAGKYLVDLEMTRFRIVNVPTYSWVLEHGADADDAGASNLAGYANAGDAVAVSSPGGDAPYMESPSLTTGNFLCEDVPCDVCPASGPCSHTPNRKYSVTFFMMENKRTADCDTYAARAASAPANAAYAELSCRLIYRHPATGETQEVDATYRVHLGYSVPKALAASAQADPADFNSCRNSRYTYNVNVVSAEKIELQATSTGDVATSGASGDMTVTPDGASWSLDAHYCVFPITLTADDIANLSYRIEAWDGSMPVTILPDNVPAEGSSKYKYYDWIELVKHDASVAPSSGTVKSIMPYPGNNSDKILHLADLKTAGAGDYTVFINEYVYAGSDWSTYVNLPERRFWIYGAQDSRQENGGSSLNKAKYAASQRSIQAYADGSGSALGVEHYNECFGMNVRWTDYFNTSEIIYWSRTNGKWNTWQGLGYSYVKKAEKDRIWSNYVTDRIQHVNEITNTNQGYEFTAARYFPVNALVLLKDSELNKESYGDTSKQPIPYVSSSYTSIYYNVPGGVGNIDPQPVNSDTFEPDKKQFFNAITACLNRNRDLNGDDKITEDEVKWFLPTTRDMINISIGRNNLTTPLFDFAAAKLPYAASDNNNPRFYYLGSDGSTIQPDFGNALMADGKGNAAWQIRCVRRLGADSETTGGKETEFPTAYIHDSANHLVIPSLASASLRNRATGILDLHDTRDPRNRICRYGFEYKATGKFITPAESFADSEWTEQNLNEISRQGGPDGWRLPNQKEVTILSQLGIFADNDAFKSDNYVLSCTRGFYTGVNRPGASTDKSSYIYTSSKINVASIDLFGFNKTRTMYVIYVRDLTEEEYKAAQGGR